MRDSPDLVAVKAIIPGGRVRPPCGRSEGSVHPGRALRVGIGHPGDRNEVVNYVLKAPRKEEQLEIDKALDRCLLTWPKLAIGDYEAAQRVLHTKAV